MTVQVQTFRILQTRNGLHIYDVVSRGLPSAVRLYGVAHIFVGRITGHQHLQHGNLLRAVHEVKGDGTNQRGQLEVHHLSDGILYGIYTNCNNYGNLQQYSGIAVHNYWAECE